MDRLKLFAKITIFPCVLITIIVPLFFLLSSFSLPTHTENPCLIWLTALFFLLSILDTIQNIQFGALLALNASVTALSITSLTYGLLVTAVVAVIGYNRDDSDDVTKGKDVKDLTERLYITMPDQWT